MKPAPHGTRTARWWWTMLGLGWACAAALGAPDWAEADDGASRGAPAERGADLSPPPPGLRVGGAVRRPRGTVARTPPSDPRPRDTNDRDIAGEAGEAAGPVRPRPARRRVRRDDRSPGGSPGAPTWEGPGVELAYARYSLVDGFGGGGVDAVQLRGFLHGGVFRLSFAGELGARSLAFDATDLVLRGDVGAGLQLPHEWFQPYVAAVITVGVTLGKRFETPQASVVRGAGGEVGVALRLVGPLWLGGAIAYLRATMDGLAHDLVVLRVGVGL